MKYPLGTYARTAKKNIRVPIPTQSMKSHPDENTVHQIPSKKKNKAGYTATKVACGWARAVMKKSNSNIWPGMPENAKNAKKANGDRPTDRPT